MSLGEKALLIASGKIEAGGKNNQAEQDKGEDTKKPGWKRVVTGRLTLYFLVI